MYAQFGSGRFEVFGCAHVKVMARLVGKMAVVERAKPTEQKQIEAKDKCMGNKFDEGGRTYCKVF